MSFFGSGVKKDGGPAFPCELTGDALGFHEDSIEAQQMHMFSGMTLRDYFAGQALIGYVIAGIVLAQTAGDAPSPEDIAADAIRLADAMIIERDK